jgi:anti-sigma factor RsiW
MTFYLDDELHGSERHEFELHVRECAVCGSEVERERSFLESVRSSGGHKAPMHLASKIERLLEDEVVSDAASPALRRRITRLLGGSPTGGARRRATAVAAGLAITTLLVTGWLLARRPIDDGSASSKFASMAVDSHQRHVRGQLPLEIASASPVVVSEWFSGKVGFGFKLPTYQETSGQEHVYELLGARLVGFANDYAAYVAYRMGDRPISLVVTSASSATPEGGQQIASRGLMFHFEMISGLKVITWSDRGLTYALVSDLEERGQQSCVVCHEGTRDRDFIEGLRPTT